MSRKVMEELVDKRESVRLVFEAANAPLEGVAASVCALLNTDGGTVIVGIRGPGQVEGVPDVEQKVEEIEQFLHESLGSRALLSVNKDETSHGGVITIDVPVGTDRPYVCRGTIYVRKGKHTVPADVDTIRRLVNKRYVEATSWERLTAPGLELGDLDESVIRRTVEDAQRKRNYTFGDPGDLPSVLNDLGLVQSGELTNGAEVLFAKNPSRRLPQTLVRATVFETDKGGDFVDDQMFEGNAFVLVDQLTTFVFRHVKISAEFKRGKVTREDRPQYPFWAVREGLINAIIHRDYAFLPGGMSVGIYPNRLEIWNTGRLPQGLEISDLKKNHPSLPANPQMARVFYLRELIERWGRGTLKIVDESKAAGLRSPQWVESPAGITLTFFARTSRLNRRQKDLLDRLKPGDELRPSKYYEDIASVVSQRQAQRDLSALESGGWLRQEGEGPATVYVRTDKRQP